MLTGARKSRAWHCTFKIAACFLHMGATCPQFSSTVSISNILSHFTHKNIGICKITCSNFWLRKYGHCIPSTTTNARWLKELIFLMVHLSQLLRKDNFLTIEAIEEIIGDKFDGFNYVFFKAHLFGLWRKSTKQKGKREAIDWGAVIMKHANQNLNNHILQEEVFKTERIWLSLHLRG